MSSFYGGIYFFMSKSNRYIITCQYSSSRGLPVSNKKFLYSFIRALDMHHLYDTYSLVAKTFQSDTPTSVFNQQKTVGKKPSTTIFKHIKNRMDHIYLNIKIRVTKIIQKKYYSLFLNSLSTSETYLSYLWHPAHA